MEVIDNSLRIYRVSFDALTVKQVHEMCSGWNDQDRLGSLILFYEEDEDRLLIGPGITAQQVFFCMKALSSEPNEALKRLDRIQLQFQCVCNQMIIKILKKVITNRMQRGKENEMMTNPSPRFISTDGDIFQISKIVSVKRRDDGSHHYIEFYITNKKSSIRKEYNSQLVRDSEFFRIQKILEAA